MSREEKKTYIIEYSLVNEQIPVGASNIQDWLFTLETSNLSREKSI